MNHQEFIRWHDYHRLGFPGLSAWLQENVGQIRYWEQSLAPVPYHVAVNATDQLLIEENAIPYSNHVRFIRSYYAAQQDPHGKTHCWGPRIKDDQLTAECTLCMDYGVVSVLSPATLANARAGKERFAIQPCALACDCLRGDERLKGLGLQYEHGHLLIRVDDVVERAVDLLVAGECSDTGLAMCAASVMLVQEHDRRGR